MNIAFKEIDQGITNEIFVDGAYIGTVTTDIWNGKWIMKPDFNYYGLSKSTKKIKYDSFYKAGKAMAKLYIDTFALFEESGDTDTLEFDMRGIIKQRGP